MPQTKVYSPIQAALGAFLGGPIASTVFINQNYRAVNNESAQSQSLIIGSLIVLAFILIVPFLPENFPGIIIAIATILATRLIVEKKQFTKEAIEQNDKLTFHSNWRVFGIGLASLIIMVQCRSFKRT